MKNLAALILGFLAILPANAAPPRGVLVERDVSSLAKILQARLPSLAEDGMCEVERQDNGWDFVIRVKPADNGARLLQVNVRATADSRSEIRVQGVRVESSLITSKRSAPRADH